MKLLRKNKIQLDLAWEAIQDLYTTYANIWAYKYGLSKFCSFGEKTYLIKITRKRIQAFYDKNETTRASKNGLQDFLEPQWKKVFRQRSLQAIGEAQRFIRRYYLRSHTLKKVELIKAIRWGTKINHDLFVVFAACQPQYTAYVADYIKSLLPGTISGDDQDSIVITLSLSTRKTPLLEEEIAWSKVVAALKHKFGAKIPRVSRYDFLELKRHAERYGLMRTADGLQPWSEQDLYQRLLADINNHEVLDVVERWDLQKRNIEQRKKKILQSYPISKKVIGLCKAIGDLGYLRLCLRVKGWMPMSYILIHELFPQLPRYVPYTLEQLISTKPSELFEILKGNHVVSQRELEGRFNFVLFGLVDGREVLWYGKQAERTARKLIPLIDTHKNELRGQLGMKGYVKGICFIIHWDSEDILQDVATMPKRAVLVAGQTRPQLMPAIKKASAIVTDEGGLLSHAAIVSRELGVPCIIGTKFATKVLKTGDLVEVDANRGVVRIIRRARQ